MGNSIKGAGDIRREHRAGDSAETDGARSHGHSQINRPVSAEIRQPSDIAEAINYDRRSSNKANNHQYKTSEDNDDKREGTNDYKDMQNAKNIVSFNDERESNTKHLQDSQENTTIHQIKQKKYVKTPIPSRSRLNTSDNNGELQQDEYITRRPYSTMVTNKTSTTKSHTKRSFSEPITKLTEGDRSELDFVQVGYLDDNEDSVIGTDLGIDTEESELEFGSSVRSASLDSSLFDSQITIQTHSSIEQRSTASIMYNENRSRLKRGLLGYYKSTSFTMPEFPLLPYTDDLNKFLPPWMTVTKRFDEEKVETPELNDLINNLDTLDMDDYEYDKNVTRLNHIFNHEDRYIRNIYIVGDSGTGKTAFCRYLIQKWCLQHQSKESVTDSKDPMYSRLEAESISVESDTLTRQAKYVGSRKSNGFKEQSTKRNSYLSDMSHDHFSDTNELDKFEFLFYIPLFYQTNHDNILQMIDTQFKYILDNMRTEASAQSTRTRVSFLSELFEKESDKCIIILDGFDQWKQGNKKLSKPHLPVKDPNKNYTVIVTSTSKQLEAVDVKATPDDLEVLLNGIDETTSNIMINDLINMLNKTAGLRKRAIDFIEEMHSWKSTNFKRLPFVLQSILYLWYHSGTIGNTVCDIFSRILELQLKGLSDPSNLEQNKSNRNSNSKGKPKEPFNTADKVVKLPRYFINLINCQKFKELISFVGQVALSTRKQSMKGFDSSTLEVYGITQVDISNLIKVGILTQNKVPGFSSLRHSKTVYFSDEKMQEFLASTYLVQLFQNTTYENIGRIHIHTDKIISVLKSEFDIFTSLKNIFLFSNMVVQICGLYPPTTEEITHMIFDVVKKDSRILKFRKSLETETQDNVEKDVQELISSCARESLSVNKNKMLLYIGDISYQYFEPDYVKYVPTSHVKSLLIDADKASLVSSDISYFIQETRISRGLQKLMVRDENSHLTLVDIDSIHILTQNCLQTLNVLSYVFNYNNRIIYLKITQDLHRFLPKMPNLIELELKGIKFSHTEFSTVALTLSGLTGLKRLHLFDLACEMQRCDCEEHKMDFLLCNKLEHIEVDGRQLPIIGVNKEKLFTCNLGNLPQGAEIQIFSSLRHAKSLKHFIQKVRWRPPFISQTLIKTLKTWYNLETLYLHGINFGENELIFDANMIHITNIRLVETSMGRIGWCRFIDSLQKLPQVISIVTRDILVSMLEEDVTRDPLRRPVDAETRAVMLARETERDEAFNYVIGNLNSFRVLFHIGNMFDFEKTANKK